jgi:hypothetical protein
LGTESDVIFETQTIRAVWVDEQHTISLIKVLEGFDWSIIRKAYQLTDEAQQKQEVPTYTITCNGQSKFRFPLNGSIFTNLREVINMDIPNKRLRIVVCPNDMVRRFLVMTNKMYGLQEQFNKYRFVKTMDDAMRLVEDDKRSIPR